MRHILLARYLGVLLLCFGLFACSTITPPMNQPLQQFYSPISEKSEQNNNLVIVTFSGGGTRAAALAYGVLKGLRDTTITSNGQQRSLLTEIDVISAVSGGSFTAAYYGLFGDSIFLDYEQQFLKHPVQTELISDWLLSPKHWGKLISRVFTRTDLAIEYFDKQIFKEKKFADMRKDMPVIIINSTDISTGNLFSFTPDSMRWICSDLESYPVSRAVASSSAVPVLFSPITLKNFDGCEPFEHQRTPIKASLHRDSLALGMRQYLDKKRYPYLHLVDGGIADNLGIRSILQMVTLYDNDFVKLLETHNVRSIDNVAIIVVNSSDDIPPHIAQTAEAPGLEETIGVVTTLQSRRYNVDTLDLLNEKAQQWRQQLTAKKCAEQPKGKCSPARFYIIELNLKQLPKALADETSLYATSLELPAEQVDTLISAGQFLLEHSDKYVQFVNDLNNR